MVISGDIMSFINDIMDKGKEFIEEQVEKGFNFIGQDGESLHSNSVQLSQLSMVAMHGNRGYLCLLKSSSRIGSH